MASFKTLIVYFVLLVSVNSSSFNAQENQNLVFYWGQGSAGDQQSLGYYCQQNVGDVFIISFLNEFSTGIPTLNIVGYNEMFPGTQLLHCPSIGDDIKACQSMGKMVFLSLGGASGTYGFSDGSNFAQTLWDLFGGGRLRLDRSEMQSWMALTWTLKIAFQLATLPWSTLFERNIFLTLKTKNSTIFLLLRNVLILMQTSEMYFHKVRLILLGFNSTITIVLLINNLTGILGYLLPITYLQTRTSNYMWDFQDLHLLLEPVTLPILNLTFKIFPQTSNLAGS